jgi:hypothetical protein
MVAAVMKPKQPIIEGRMLSNVKEVDPDSPRPAPPTGNKAAENCAKAKVAVYRAVNGFNTIEVYGVGTRVLIGPDSDEFSGVVDGVALYETGVEYRVVYWSGKDRKSDWLKSGELRPMTVHPLRIGFNT